MRDIRGKKGDRKSTPSSTLTAELKKPPVCPYPTVVVIEQLDGQSDSREDTIGKISMDEEIVKNIPANKTKEEIGKTPKVIEKPEKYKVFSDFGIYLFIGLEIDKTYPQVKKKENVHVIKGLDDIEYPQDHKITRALKNEYNLDVKTYKMRGTARSLFPVITDENTTLTKLKVEIQTIMHRQLSALPMGACEDGGLIHNGPRIALGRGNSIRNGLLKKNQTTHIK
ncbi:hypothetical protein JTB14_022129 [Gonioctena quinquepunctata]|nr:hypothetical protein JTB14_022129 [Gonioctena quinquepunctata]